MFYHLENNNTKNNYVGSNMYKKEYNKKDNNIFNILEVENG